MVRSRPHIILSGAITLDGKLATRTGDSKLSTKRDKIRVYKLRSKVDAIIIGKNTAKIDDPLLSIHNIKGKNPIRIILDSNGTLDTNSRIIRTCSKIPTIIAVSKKAKPRNLEKLKKFPITVLVCGNDKINIKNLLKILKQKKIKNVLLEGGGITNWTFLKEKLVDDVIITVTPYLVGGNIATTLVDGTGFSKIIGSTRLKLKNVRKVKNEIILHYHCIWLSYPRNIQK